MLASYDFADRGPRYPDALRVSAPRGFRTLIKRVAYQQGLSAAEFVRSAVSEKLAAFGAANDDPVFAPNTQRLHTAAAVPEGDLRSHPQAGRFIASLPDRSRFGTGASDDEGYGSNGNRRPQATEHPLLTVAAADADDAGGGPHS